MGILGFIVSFREMELKYTPGTKFRIESSTCQVYSYLSIKEEYVSWSQAIFKCK